ncbi:MAG: hypothetical protein RR668_08065, partial [Algoriella sp.]
MIDWLFFILENNVYLYNIVFLKKRINIMIKKMTFLLLTAMLLSCSNPLNKKYSEATLDQDSKELRESNKLTGEELELLGIWMVRAKLSGKSLEGKTYNDILSDAKNYKLEQEKLKAEAEKIEAEKAKKMNDAVTVSIIGKSFDEGEWDSSNIIKYGSSTGFINICI